MKALLRQKQLLGKGQMGGLSSPGPWRDMRALGRHRPGAGRSLESQLIPPPTPHMVPPVSPLRPWVPVLLLSLLSFNREMFPTTNPGALSVPGQV